MKANATVSVRRNAVQNKKARTTGKARTKISCLSPLRFDPCQTKVPRTFSAP